VRFEEVWHVDEYTARSTRILDLYCSMLAQAVHGTHESGDGGNRRASKLNLRVALPFLLRVAPQTSTALLQNSSQQYKEATLSVDDFDRVLMLLLVLGPPISNSPALTPSLPCQLHRYCAVCWTSCYGCCEVLCCPSSGVSPPRTSLSASQLPLTAQASASAQRPPPPTSDREPAT
jgi:hypothetical protein